MIARAAACLAWRGDVVLRKMSGLDLTKPWGGQAQEDFLNAVAEIETHLVPHDLLQAAKGVEAGLGRKSRGRWGPREIDIDILFYGDRVVRLEDLRVPHPLLLERGFVLAPLAEIAPDLVHPETGFKVSAHLDLLERDGDKSWTSPTM
jgi:2-amino-4-hydroxy-6-hydroxymethyldihydropteridine diphosphokinase